MLVAITAVLSSCHQNSRDMMDHHRYEIRIEMGTPKGYVRSSGIVELLGEPGRYYLAAEAIPIDLPDGKTVYMMVTMPGRSWEFQGPWVSGPDLPAVNSGTFRSMAPDKIPDFVTFTDESKPSTVTPVPYGNPSSVLGSGYSFRSIKVALTDKQPTSGIYKRLPWLFRRVVTLGGTSTMNLDSYPNTITAMSFKRNS